MVPRCIIAPPPPPHFQEYADICVVAASKVHIRVHFYLATFAF